MVTVMVLRYLGRGLVWLLATACLLGVTYLWVGTATALFVGFVWAVSTLAVLSQEGSKKK